MSLVKKKDWYLDIAFLGFSQRNRNIEDISRQKFRELL